MIRQKKIRLGITNWTRKKEGCSSFLIINLVYTSDAVLLQFYHRCIQKKMYMYISVLGTLKNI